MLPSTRMLARLLGEHKGLLALLSCWIGNKAKPNKHWYSGKHMKLSHR